MRTVSIRMSHNYKMNHKNHSSFLRQQHDWWQYIWHTRHQTKWVDILNAVRLESVPRFSTVFVCFVVKSVLQTIFFCMNLCATDIVSKLITRFSSVRSVAWRLTNNKRHRIQEMKCISALLQPTCIIFYAQTGMWYFLMFSWIFF